MDPSWSMDQPFFFAANHRCFTNAGQRNSIRWARNWRHKVISTGLMLGAVIFWYHKNASEPFTEIWMFPKIGVPPNHLLRNRVFHYKPSILGYPYFRKHPYKLYGAHASCKGKPTPQNSLWMRLSTSIFDTWTFGDVCPHSWHPVVSNVRGFFFNETARRCFSTPAMLYMWMARCCGQKVRVRTFQVAKVSFFLDGWVTA